MPSQPLLNSRRCGMRPMNSSCLHFPIQLMPASWRHLFEQGCPRCADAGEYCCVSCCWLPKRRRMPCPYGTQHGNWPSSSSQRSRRRDGRSTLSTSEASHGLRWRLPSSASQNFKFRTLATLGRFRWRVSRNCCRQQVTSACRLTIVF